MNRNYKNGRAKEYRTMDKLKKEGYDIVFRSAGSHSAIDVIAIRCSDRRIKFVQCKPRDFSVKKELELTDKWFWLNDKFDCEFKVV